MSYVGSKVELPLGKMGVRTDDPNSDLAPGELFKGINIDFYEGMIQAAPGTKQWNSSPVVLPGTSTPVSILNAFDYSPVEGLNRMIVACDDGQLYRFKNSHRFEVMTAASGAPLKLNIRPQSHFVSVDGTTPGSRKLIFFSGNDVPQVIDGDSTERRNITNPAVEWTNGGYPKFGIVYKNKLWTLGMSGYPHTMLASKDGDPEDFTAGTSLTGTNAQLVFPGEGERLNTMFSYRGKLFAIKYPSGVYGLDDSASTSSGWFFTKVGAAFGAISPHSATEAVDDLYVANQYGTITSMAAAFQLGNVKFADVCSNMRVEKMIREETNLTDPNARWCVYYPDKKLALFTYKSPSSADLIDKVLCIDFNGQKAKSYMLQFDTNKMNALFLMRKSDGTLVPAYCSNDGYIYQFDDVNRFRGSNDYVSEFVIPYTDFGQETMKLYDQLEVEAEHTGLWDINCDVSVDDSFSETLTFKMSNAPVLRAAPDSQCFQLDRDRLMGRQTRSIKKRLHGRGRNIAFRFYNNGDGQNFKITKLIVYTRLGAEDKKA